MDIEHRFQAGRRELVLAVPPSVDDLLEGVQDVEAIPFWAQVWDSAHGLCRFLNELVQQGKAGGRLLDLGCGVGAVGCVAAALGWQVTMTDFRIDALQYTTRNLARNGLTASVVLSDWRSFALRPVFDLVVASDVLYESSVHPELAAILNRFRSFGATLILADPGRDFALQFMAAREKEGWPVELQFRDGQTGHIAVYLVKPPPPHSPPINRPA